MLFTVRLNKGWSGTEIGTELSLWLLSNQLRLGCNILRVSIRTMHFKMFHKVKSLLHNCPYAKLLHSFLCICYENNFYKIICYKIFINFVFINHPVENSYLSYRGNQKSSCSSLATATSSENRPIIVCRITQMKNEESKERFSPQLCLWIGTREHRFKIKQLPESSKKRMCPSATLRALQKHSRSARLV